MVRSQINVGCFMEEHVVTNWGNNDEDIEVVLNPNVAGIEEEEGDVEVVLDPSADFFPESRSVSSSVIDDTKHIHRTCTTRDMSEEMEQRDNVDGDDLSDHSSLPVSFNVCTDKNYTSTSSSPPTTTKGEVEIVFEPSCDNLKLKSSLEQENPIQESSQNNGMDSRRTKTSVRFGNFVYQVVSPPGATVYPNAEQLISSLVDNDKQNKDDCDSKVAPTALKYRQMIQVDQVAQINSLDAKESEIQLQGDEAAKSAILRSSAEILRLAYDGGWVAAAEKNEKALLQPLPVWTGLWCWYVHYNCTGGLVLTKHPTNPTEQCNPNSKDSILLPLQKIYCDAKVVDDVAGKTFYRLQTKSSFRSSKCQTNGEAMQEAAIEHITQWNGWICDTTGQGEPTLLTEGQVKTDLELVVCNRLEFSMSVYSQPFGKEEDKRQMKIPPGEMVVVRKMVWPDNMETKASVENAGTTVASCMQLADRSGWVVIRSLKTARMGPSMQETQVTAGNWKFRVMHEQGIKSYTHPSTKLFSEAKEDNGDNAEIYPYASILQCDTRVTNPVTGRTYFRLKETGRWIPSEHESSKQEDVKKWVRREGTNNLSWIIELFEVDPPLKSEQGQSEDEQVWNPDFVSGIAATVPGLKKASTLGPEGSPLFEAEGGVRIHVFCAQRFVDIEVKHKNHGKMRMSRVNCSTNDLCYILRMDPMELVSAMDAVDVDRIRLEHQPKADKVDARAEKEKLLRHELLRCTSKINSLLKMQRSLINQLATFDGKRQIDLLTDLKEVLDCESIARALGTGLSRLSWLTQASSGWEADSTGTGDTDCTNSKNGSRRGLLKARRKPRAEQNRDTRNVHQNVRHTAGNVHDGLKGRAIQV